MEQLDPYFAEEATEILQTIEQILLSLFDEGKTTEKVHTLLRGAHTIKGSAASFNLDTIETIAHHLEDVFQALYAPELEIDSELTNLLLEGYECLQLPLSAMLDNRPYDEKAILDRVAAVFAQLQNKLGDFFGREAEIPSSEELGFDVVGSIFKDSVPEDLEQLQNAILDSNLDEIENVLTTQANFFLSLAQSYNLPGLKSVSQTILTASEAHPERILEIALAALENLQQARDDILAGDREQGGEVSLELRTFVADLENATQSEVISETIDNFEGEQTKAIPEEQEFQTKLEPLEIVQSSPDSDLETEKQNSNEQIIKSSSDSSLSSSDSPLVQLAEIETINNSSSCSAFENSSPIERILNSIWTPDLEVEKVNNIFSVSQPTKSEKKALSQTIKISVELLDSLSQSIGELIVEENQNFLQSEQLNDQIKTTAEQFYICQKQIDKIREWYDKIFRSSKFKKRKRKLKSEFKNKIFSEASHSICYLKEPTDRFDSLEMDTYSDLHVLLQNLTEKISDLGEEIDNIKINIQKSYLQARKRKQIIFSTRDNLFDARMVEISTVLNRFPRIIEQIIDKHQKQARLEIIGENVLIDKAISERLYEPLLHLIRNSYDHGLESAETRLQNGKSTVGTITIHASHRGNRTTIKVSDDGAGLNWKKIGQKALKRNLISENQLDSITEPELTEILFEPGFSTADSVSDLSGRGVGLDAVRSRLKSIDSSISVQSIPGRGTTFTLQLPLNLTTARLLICQCSGITYALISKAIEQIILPRSEQIQNQKSPNTGTWQTYLIWNENERLVEIRPLSNLFQYCYPLPQKDRNSSLSSFPLQGSDRLDPILILKQEERIFCLQVDRVLFEQEIVIKSLANKIDLPSYIQGYSVLGDGHLTLVVDPIELISQNWDKRNFKAFTSLPPSKNFPSLEPAKLLPESKKDSSQEPKNITILAIEDSIVQRKNLVKNIKENGYQVLEASNGKEGLTKLKRNPKIKLILCDIEMPIMNGFEFLKYCHQHPDFSKIPIIILTTRGGDKHRQLALDLGARKYLTKPSSPQKILELISELTN